MSKWETDITLLDTLAQPTAYEARRYRTASLVRYTDLCRQLAIARLSEHNILADFLGKKIEAYMSKYQFTQEELHERSTQD
jgi:hypothetical protein